MTEMKLLEDLGKNDRYFFSLFGVFILGLLLLFYKDLSEWMRYHFVPAYTIYITGTALIAQAQNMLGNRLILRCEAEEKKFIGLESWQFSIIVASHVLWLALLIWHLYSCQAQP